LKKHLSAELTPKSGNYNDVLYFSERKSDLYNNRYKKIRDKVHAELLLKGKESKGMGKAFFRTQVLDELRVVQRTQPHACRYCEDKVRLTERGELINRLLVSLNPEEGDKDEISELNLELSDIERRMPILDDHQDRMIHQRNYVTNLRGELKEGEVLVFQDFVSWYDANKKVNDLVLVMEWRENGQPRRRYIDCICQDADTNAHTHYFASQSWWRVLSETDHFKKFHTIYRVSDNGNPMVCRFSAALDCRITENFGITIHVIPLCPHHAQNLCDSHGGHVKPAMKRFALENPGVTITDEQIEQIIVNVCNETFCVVMPKILLTWVHRFVYADWVVDGLEGIGPLKNARTTGHYKVLNAKKGWVLSRKFVTRWNEWGHLTPIPDGFEQYWTGWQFSCVRRASHGCSFCHLCSDLFSEACYKKMHACVFTVRGRKQFSENDDNVQLVQNAEPMDDEDEKEENNEDKEVSGEEEEKEEKDDGDELDVERDDVLDNGLEDDDLLNHSMDGRGQSDRWWDRIIKPHIPANSAFKNGLLLAVCGADQWNLVSVVRKTSRRPVKIHLQYWYDASISASDDENKVGRVIVDNNMVDVPPVDYDQIEWQIWSYCRDNALSRDTHHWLMVEWQIDEGNKQVLGQDTANMIQHWYEEVKRGTR
jgi:hypothetical protein